MWIELIVTAIAFFPSYGNPYLQDQALWLMFFLCLVLHRWGYGALPMIVGSMCIWQGLHAGSQVFDITNPQPLWVLLSLLICLLIDPGYVRRILFTLVPVISIRLFMGRFTLINSSLDAMFLASMLPYLERVRYFKKYWLVLPIAAILYSGSSTGLLCLAISSVYYIRWYALWYLPVGALGFLALPTQYFDDGGRVGLWKLTLSHLWHSPHRLFGWGIDTFTPIVSKVELDNGARQLLYVTSHNDFVRVLFEMGLVGLAVVLVAIVFRFTSLNFKQRIVLLSICAGACLQNPTGHPAFLLLIFTLL